MNELSGINIPTLGEDSKTYRLRALNNKYTEIELDKSHNFYYVRKRRAEENDDPDNERYERQWSAIDTLGNKLKAFLVDRTRTIDDFYAILGPLPPYPDYKVDYNIACDRKSIELLRESKEKNIEMRISWSGGIDSTNAMAGLYKYLDYPEFSNNEIYVCLNQKSIDEYPWMYENIIKKHPRIHEYRGEIYAEEGKGENEALGLNMSRPVADGYDDYMVVTGELGDQIFGAKILIPDIKANGTKGLVEMHYSEVFSPDMARYLKPLADAMPEHWPRDCGNMMHWMNFILKWQWCQIRMFIMYPVPYLKFRHFYDDNIIQQWALQNDMSVKMPEWNLKRYKEPAKRYIADVTGDEGYFINKEKEDSQRCTINVFESDPSLTGLPTEGYRRHWTAMDIDYNKEWKNCIQNNIEKEIDDDGKGEIFTLKTTLDL
jgi:hypothetical protein